MFAYPLQPKLDEVLAVDYLTTRIVEGAVMTFDLVDASPGCGATITAAPVALFEIILLPFWLFFKGFKMPDMMPEENPIPPRSTS
ncbi:MAG: hypothetical protein IT332_03360 [Ardenticatenales bacterium]|nr:hypothetical protein [Ardenticatenales bacterium]